MGRVASHLMDKAMDKLADENCQLIMENGRLTRDADAKHRAWQAACQDLTRAQEEIRILRNANECLKATIARLTRAGKGEA